MATTEKSKQQSRSPRLKGVLLLILALLPVFLLFKGDGNGRDRNAVLSAPGKGLTASRGPFAQPPLNSSQVDDLRHLVKRMSYKRLASLYVSHMTLDEELGQLFMVLNRYRYYSADLEQTLEQFHVGGVILYQSQMETFDQTRHDIAEMQKHATFPLLISTDEEGGTADRLSNIYPRRPGATEIFETGDVHVAAHEGTQAAHDLLALGINADIAPDVDVAVINGPDQQWRTFGSTAPQVIAFAGAYLNAMQQAGEIACLKHYPGLGAAQVDAHYALPIINRSREEIYSVELAPYKAFIQAKNPFLHPGMIMTTDLLMPAIDPVMPAELSHTFITRVLRQQLGYDGVVLTDSLFMEGIYQTWSFPEAVVLAIKAGDDMIIGASGVSEMKANFDALKQALKNGTLSKQRIDESVSRILALKMQYHLMAAVPPQA
jgi:beta-N-acetylhexosaminidase